MSILGIYEETDRLTGLVLEGFRVIVKVERLCPGGFFLNLSHGDFDWFEYWWCLFLGGHFFRLTGERSQSVIYT